MVCPLSMFCKSYKKGEELCKDKWLECPIARNKSDRVKMYKDDIVNSLNQMKDLSDKILELIGKDIDEDWLRKKAYQLRFMYWQLRRVYENTVSLLRERT